MFKLLKVICKGDWMSFIDTFGKGLMAYYRGSKAPHSIHRDDGLVDEVSFDTYFSEYESWPWYEKEALRYVKGKILDVGCGAGRHSLWLQKKGFEVSAIDISPMAVEVARLRGVKDCRVMSALELSFDPNSFDTVLLFGNNFGIAGNITNTKKMLRILYRITTKNGQIITTCRNPFATDKPIHLRYHELNRNRGRPAGQITIRIEYKGELSDWFELLMVSPQEIDGIVKAANWKIKKVFEGENGIYAAVLDKL